MYIPGSEKGWFKKGDIPKNHKEVGTEVVSSDGYVKVKIAEPNKWVLKHRLVWEKEKGKLAPDNVIIFVDGNKQNCDISNLRLATKSELVVLNHKRRIQFNNSELNQAGITLTRIELKLSGKE